MGSQGLSRVPARLKLPVSAAARKAASRARKCLVQVNVEFPADVAELFRAFVARQVADGRALSQSQVVVELVKQQLLRKR